MGDTLMNLKLNMNIKAPVQQLSFTKPESYFHSKYGKIVLQRTFSFLHNMRFLVPRSCPEKVWPVWKAVKTFDGQITSSAHNEFFIFPKSKSQNNCIPTGKISVFVIWLYKKWKWDRCHIWCDKRDPNVLSILGFW